VARDVGLVGTGLLGVHRVSLLAGAAPGGARARVLTGPRIHRRGHQDEGVPGHVDVLVGVLVALDEAAQEAEALQYRLLEEEEPLGVGVLPELCSPVNQGLVRVIGVNGDLKTLVYASSAELN
jgi:hypothetical protein